MREELLDLAITSLVEFPMNEHCGAAGGGASVVGAIGHLVTAVDQQHQASSERPGGGHAAAIAGIAAAGKPATGKFYDCCIEAHIAG